MIKSFNSYNFTLANILFSTTCPNEAFTKEELHLIWELNCRGSFQKGDVVGYFTNIFIHEFENRERVKGEILKTVKVLLVGIWDGDKVVLNDKHKTAVRNLDWLIKLPSNWNIEKNNFRLIYRY